MSFIIHNENILKIYLIYGLNFFKTFVITSSKFSIFFLLILFLSYPRHKVDNIDEIKKILGTKHYIVK